MFIVFYTIQIVYLVYLWIVPHPIGFVTHTQIHGMYVCMVSWQSSTVNTSVMHLLTSEATFGDVLFKWSSLLLYS
jgi:hypothetical protein